MAIQLITKELANGQHVPDIEAMGGLDVWEQYVAEQENVAMTAMIDLQKAAAKAEPAK